MPTILISGAANGIGAAFVEAYRILSNTTIIAVDKCWFTHPSENVQCRVLDVTSEESVTAFGQKFKRVAIDLVIHSAGIRGLVPEVEDEHPDDVPVCETMGAMNAATMLQTFQINTVGTFLLLRSVLPNLKATSNPKVIVMTSRMGSIGNNEHPMKDAGSAYAYRASKAALNMVVRSFAADVPEINFVLCHPGRVESKLVLSKEAGAISAEESVRGLLPLIDSWGKDDSGKFHDRFGDAIQW